MPFVVPSVALSCAKLAVLALPAALLLIAAPQTRAGVIIDFAVSDPNPITEWYGSVADASVQSTVVPADKGSFSAFGYSWLASDASVVELEYNAPKTVVAAALLTATGPKPAANPGSDTQSVGFTFSIVSPDLVGPASRPVAFSITYTGFNYNFDINAYNSNAFAAPDPLTFELTGGRTLTVAFQGAAFPSGQTFNTGSQRPLRATFTLVPEPASAAILALLGVAAATRRR